MTPTAEHARYFCCVALLCCNFSWHRLLRLLCTRFRVTYLYVQNYIRQAWLSNSVITSSQRLSFHFYFVVFQGTLLRPGGLHSQEHSINLEITL
jgi:hypothetical protein